MLAGMNGNRVRDGGRPVDPDDFSVTWNDVKGRGG